MCADRVAGRFFRRACAATDGSLPSAADSRLSQIRNSLLAYAVGPLLAHGCFPVHEIIERSSSFVLNKFDDICIIDEAEKWGPVWNQIEWVDQIL
jgi:hypothetical protein